MPSQFVWIGITAGIFCVGLITGVGLYEGSMNTDNMSMQNPQMKMNDLDFKEQMMDMIDLDDVLNDPQKQQQMMEVMMKNQPQMQKLIMINMQDFDQMQMMEDMMEDMMERMKTDPELEKAMMEHMDKMSSSGETMIDSMMNQGVK
jgi:hypothetical protein